MFLTAVWIHDIRWCLAFNLTERL